MSKLKALRSNASLNGWIVIDKSKGVTSASVVNQVKKIVEVKRKPIEVNRKSVESQ